LTSISKEFKLLIAFIIVSLPKKAAAKAMPGAAYGAPKTKKKNAHPNRKKF
jgi:hypothetical protein